MVARAVDQSGGQQEALPLVHRGSRRSSSKSAASPHLAVAANRAGVASDSDSLDVSQVAQQRQRRSESLTAPTTRAAPPRRALSVVGAPNRGRAQATEATETTVEFVDDRAGPGQGSGKKLDNLPAVLFLDVDGVLHPTTVRHPRQQFQRSCMALLAEVLEATGARIVLSTAWRLDPMARREVSEKLREHGIPQFISRTPNLSMFHRAKEILAWVRKYRPATWVSVDDWPLLDENPSEMRGHFVQTRPRFGLLPETAGQIVESFRAQKLEMAQQ